MIAHHRGFALILVIWSLVLLASLATGFAYAVRHQARVAADVADVARAEAAATAALHTMVLTLGMSDREARRQSDIGIHRVAWPQADITVQVKSESGRIDVNRAPRELLAGLFALLLPDANPEALADALIDWRDRDDRPGPAGAEQAAYAEAGYVYGPANTAFYSVNELSQVIGFDSRIVETVRPYLTVYSRQPRLNAASADLIALQAIPGIDQAAAQAFIAQRDNALANGDEVDYTPLRDARRYVNTRPGDRLLSLDIEVRLDDGFRRHEHAVLRLNRRGGHTLLAREARFTAATPEAGPDDGR